VETPASAGVRRHARARRYFFIVDEPVPEREPEAVPLALPESEPPVVPVEVPVDPVVEPVVPVVEPVDPVVEPVVDPVVEPLVDPVVSVEPEVVSVPVVVVSSVVRFAGIAGVAALPSPGYGVAGVAAFGLRVVDVRDGVVSALLWVPACVAPLLDPSSLAAKAGAPRARAAEVTAVVMMSLMWWIS
jgi:hypothetical protein